MPKRMDMRMLDESGNMVAAVRAAADFCARDRFRGGIYFHGPVGCGKTLIASKMLFEAARQVAASLTEADAWTSYSAGMGSVGRIVSVPALLARIRATFEPDGERTSDVVNDCRFGTVVALDDIGAEKPTEWVRDTLFQIIDWRYGAMLATVFTSNCDTTQLAQRLGERIADRILEMCQGRIVEITCGSYRG